MEILHAEERTELSTDENTNTTEDRWGCEQIFDMGQTNT
jgi:hypothetical protein